MGALLARVAAPSSLAADWADVLAADAEDDTLSAGVRRFRDDAESELASLHTSLTAGTYQPATLTEIDIPKPDGGSRTLRIPRVRDRIVERAILGVLGPTIEQLLGPSSFAYRPGLGVADAVREVARLCDEGYGWVLRTDVHDCFPSVLLDLVRRQLTTLVPDARLRAALDAMLFRPARRPGRSHTLVPRGLPQGAPLLSNLVLEAVDERVRRAGFPLVRYGDGLCVLADSGDHTWEAARIVSSALEEIGMAAGPGKTEVWSFAEGFSFLGEDFGHRYPPVVEHGVRTPQRRRCRLARAGDALSGSATGQRPTGDGWRRSVAPAASASLPAPYDEQDLVIGGARLEEHGGEVGYGAAR